MLEVHQEDKKKKADDPEEQIAVIDEPCGALFEAADVQEIDFFGRSAFAWVQVGDTWHLPVGDRRDIWVRQVSAHGYRVVLNDERRAVPLTERELPLAYALGVAEDWVRAQKVDVLVRKDASWRSDPASEKQIAALLKFGMTSPAGLTKGAASELLQEKFSSQRAVNR